MAKRFVDTNKFKKPFIKSLKGSYKLLWEYINLDCDHAGVWIKDFEVAQIRIGQDMKINEKEALKVFNNNIERIIPFDNNEKWFIPSFLKEQYPKGLNNNKPAIVSVKELLDEYNLLIMVNELFGNGYLMIN